MAVKNIKELFLFSNYKIIVFEGGAFYYRISGSNVCHSVYESKNADAVSTEFSNKRVDVSNYKMLGKLSELTDKKCETIFKEARVSEYPNFEIIGETLKSPLDSIKGFLRNEGYKDESRTWIIIPKPSKKLVGKKIMVKFNIVYDGFENEKGGGGCYYKDIELPVYMTDIKDSNITEIKYSIEIPDHLYDFLMLHPELDKRPKSKTFTTETFSGLHSYLAGLCSDATALVELDKDMKSVKKVILLKFNSGQSETRDSYAFGYAGKKTSISFTYFVGYKSVEKIESGLLGHTRHKSTCIYVDKKYFSGEGFQPTKGRLVPVMDTESYTILDWTEEREEFLKRTEGNFKSLSDRLNEYLSDMTSEKLELLMSSGLKMLDSSSK